MTRLSVRYWLTSRQRAAPIAVRRANSCRRAWTFDIINPATFTQHSSSTIPTRRCINLAEECRQTRSCGRHPQIRVPDPETVLKFEGNEFIDERFVIRRQLGLRSSGGDFRSEAADRAAPSGPFRGVNVFADQNG